MTTQPIALPVAPARRRLNPTLLLLTGGYIALIGWITLSTAGNSSAIGESSTWIIRMLTRLPLGLGGAQWEFLLNVAMFAPLGLLLVLTFGARFFWVAVLGSLALTFSLEGFQQFIPSRVPDVRDLVANGVGGVLGMALGLALLAVRPRG